MPITMYGSTGISTPGIDSKEYNGGQLAGFRNKIINGNFPVNQRVVSGTVVLAAGEYGHDRWKAGSGGCTYTFNTVENVTTITISSGTLMQVIEGNNLMSGQHVLSWQGTAQGRVDSGSYGNSGLVLGTAVGGTNQTIEFGTGTLSLVQYEPGTVPTSFEFLPECKVVEFCERYYERLGNSVSNEIYVVQYAAAGNGFATSFSWNTPKRAVPATTKVGTWPTWNCGQPTIAQSGIKFFSLEAVATSAGQAVFGTNNAGTYVEGDAEL